MLQGVLSNEILFEDDFSSLDQFTTSEDNVAIGIFTGCPFSTNFTGNLFCARFSNIAFMWTNSGLINTVGYTNIILSVDISFRNWSDSALDQWGKFNIRGYPNITGRISEEYQFSAEFDHLSFGRTPVLDGYTMEYWLGSWAENSTTLIFQLTLSTSSDPLVFIDNMQVI